MCKRVAGNFFCIRCCISKAPRRTSAAHTRGYWERFTKGLVTGTWEPRGETTLSYSYRSRPGGVAGPAEAGRGEGKGGGGVQRRSWGEGGEGREGYWAGAMTFSEGTQPGGGWGDRSAWPQSCPAFPLRPSSLAEHNWKPDGKGTNPLPEGRAVGLEEVTCTGSQGGLPEEVCKRRPLTRRRPAGEEGREGRGGPRVQPEHSVSSARTQTCRPAYGGGWMSLQLEAGFLHVRG